MREKNEMLVHYVAWLKLSFTKMLVYQHHRPHLTFVNKPGITIFSSIEPGDWNILRFNIVLMTIGLVEPGLSIGQRQDVGDGVGIDEPHHSSIVWWNTCMLFNRQ